MISSLNLITEHYQEIVGLVFKYIDLLQQSGAQKWIFDEVNSCTSYHWSANFIFVLLTWPILCVSLLVTKEFDVFLKKILCFYFIFSTQRNKEIHQLTKATYWVWLLQKCSYVNIYKWSIIYLEKTTCKISDNHIWCHMRKELLIFRLES